MKIVGRVQRFRGRARGCRVRRRPLAPGRRRDPPGLCGPRSGDPADGEPEDRRGADDRRGCGRQAGPRQGGRRARRRGVKAVTHTRRWLSRGDGPRAGEGSGRGADRGRTEGIEPRDPAPHRDGELGDRPPALRSRCSSCTRGTPSRRGACWSPSTARRRARGRSPSRARPGRPLRSSRVTSCRGRGRGSRPRSGRHARGVRRGSQGRRLEEPSRRPRRGAARRARAGGHQAIVLACEGRAGKPVAGSVTEKVLAAREAAGPRGPVVPPQPRRALGGRQRVSTAAASSPGLEPVV